eukprot:1190813-Prorocentrum_minimum.AAC.2
MLVAKVERGLLGMLKIAVVGDRCNEANRVPPLRTVHLVIALGWSLHLCITQHPLFTSVIQGQGPRASPLFPSSLEDDESLLTLTTLGPKLRAAIVVRLREKQLLVRATRHLADLEAAREANTTVFQRVKAWPEGVKSWPEGVKSWPEGVNPGARGGPGGQHHRLPGEKSWPEGVKSWAEGVKSWPEGVDPPPCELVWGSHRGGTGGLSGSSPVLLHVWTPGLRFLYRIRAYCNIPEAGTNRRRDERIYPVGGIARPAVWFARTRGPIYSFTP